MNKPKPCAPAAERNKHAILSAMQQLLHAHDTVFEFGSGTGQHACHIAAAMPGIVWQPSELEDKLAGIEQWIDESGCSNIRKPVTLDLSDTKTPPCKASVCFTANTLHIVSWFLVERLFMLSAAILGDSGRLCIYGPFSFGGQHSSETNKQFDQQLRSKDPDSGIRDVDKLQLLARDNGFSDVRVLPMPSNNHLLVWQRDRVFP